MYEPTTVEIDRVCGEGNYRSYSIYFVGRLIGSSKLATPP